MESIRVVKHSEVYDRIVCDPGVAHEISDYFTFDVPGAKFSPAYRNKVWDGKIRIFNVFHGLLYCGLRTHLEKFAKARQYTIDYDFETADSQFSLKEAEEFITDAKFKLTPREHQLMPFVHGVRRGRALFLSPTASGKSFIIYLLTRYYNSKTLIIVPTVSLVHQMASDFDEYAGYPEDTHKIHAGQTHDTKARIIVTTWQSIYKQPSSWFDQFDVVIGDEAHLFKAKSLVSIMSKTDKVRHKFGFTGTLDNSQCHHLILEGLFGPVKQVVTTAQLIEKKLLAEISIKCIMLSYPDPVRKVMTKASYQDEIDYLVRNQARNNFIKNLALSLSGNSLLLFQFVDKHGIILRDLIMAEAKGRPVHYVDGSVDGSDREAIRSIVETQKNAIIVASYKTFSTGINIKNLHSVILASPTKSKITNLQSIGRSLRVSDAKTTATLYDISDDLSWKSKKNYTYLHFVERVKIYAAEKFPYKFYKVKIDT